ncbi:hypothetical protein GOBAR_AA40155 [Gossypium barbadense]|uniref:Uncharacterized protein n=1 Tax=Gossypium barbadense TaxID=3634 RepID=A0A2P5VP44_GOSBA|nr:hypothetical protein GOBAR_AA40155 [Gossypium barbadense]
MYPTAAIWDVSNCRRVRTMEGYRSRVGVLAWSSFLLSSSSHDKSILQRDMRARDDFSIKLFGHKKEVCGLKLSYNEHELASGCNENRYGLRASGGGATDRCIRFRDTTTNTHLSCMDTGSQLATLTGHTTRVLYLAISLHEQKIVTGSRDETLCFWKLFPISKSQKSDSKVGASSFGRTTIR